MDADVAHLAGAATLVAAGGALSALVSLHVLPSGLSPLRDAVSQYGISRLHLGYRIATIMLGLAGIFTSIGVADGLAGSTSAVVAPLVIFGLARLVISWYPMDEPGAPPTSIGRAHGLIAIVTFISATIAAIRLGFDLSSSGEWHGALRWIQASGGVMFAALIGMAFGRRAPEIARYFGLLERLFYLAMVSFFGTAGAALIWSVH